MTPQTFGQGNDGGAFRHIGTRLQPALNIETVPLPYASRAHPPVTLCDQRQRLRERQLPLALFKPVLGSFVLAGLLAVVFRVITLPRRAVTSSTTDVSVAAFVSNPAGITAHYNPYSCYLPAY